MWVRVDYEKWLPKQRKAVEAFISVFVRLAADYRKSFCHGYLPLYSTVCTVQYSPLTGYVVPHCHTPSTELILLHDPIRHRPTVILVQLHAGSCAHLQSSPLFPVGSGYDTKKVSSWILTLWPVIYVESSCYYHSRKTVCRGELHNISSQTLDTTWFGHLNF